MSAHPEPTIDELMRQASVLSQRHAELVGARHDLGRNDLMAMTAMAQARIDGRSLTAGEVSHELDLSPSATTALLDRLGRMGHVTRSHADGDRRRVVVEMTDAAMAEARGMFVPMSRAMGHVRADFSDSELEVVHRYLTGVVAAVGELIETLKEPASATSPEA